MKKVKNFFVERLAAISGLYNPTKVFRPALNKTLKPSPKSLSTETTNQKKQKKFYRKGLC